MVDDGWGCDRSGWGNAEHAGSNNTGWSRTRWRDGQSHIGKGKIAVAKYGGGWAHHAASTADAKWRSSLGGVR